MSEKIQENNDIMLKLENVCYTYEDGTEALKGVNLQVLRGEKLAIMGANGSGKSTLFLTLNGIYKPNSGKIFLEDTPIDYSRKGLLSLRRKIGIVFQDPDNQLFSASVAQEISFGVLNLGVPEVEARRRVENVIGELNITPFKEKPTHFLSGGQKKRVTVADILVMDPEIMILDEPAVALDPKHARIMDTIIDELSNRGITLILSTHDVERALIWADRVVLLNDGIVIDEGAPKEIFQKEEVLAQTNLEKPTVLKIFDTLCEVGVLDKKMQIPRTADELEELIRKTRKSNENN